MQKGGDKGHSSRGWNPWRRQGSFQRKLESIIVGQHEFMKTYCVYIMASKKNGTLYTGVTGDLRKRVYERKNDLIEGFTKRYGVHRLVYFEFTSDVQSALRREKQIKAWKRAWKVELIENMNPDWLDLYDSL